MHWVEEPPQLSLTTWSCQLCSQPHDMIAPCTMRDLPSNKYRKIIQKVPAASSAAELVPSDAWLALLLGEGSQATAIPSCSTRARIRYCDLSSDLLNLSLAVYLAPKGSKIQHHSLKGKGEEPKKCLKNYIGSLI